MNMISKAHLKYIKSLQIKKYRNQTNKFLVEGEKSVLELLKSGFKINTLLTTKRFLAGHIELLTAKHVDYIEVSDAIMKKASTLQLNQTALAVVEKPEYPPLDITEYQFLPLFEGLQDPGNIGTILRICDWYGIKALTLSNDSVDVFNPKVIQASMGSFLRVKVYYVDILEFLLKKDRPVLSAVIKGESIHQFHWPESGILVFGNESQGISGQVLRKTDHMISIPRYGDAESLNVAVASAVVFDNLFRENS